MEGNSKLITGIILASGLSRRMAGADKLLLPVAGLPMVEHVLRAASGSRLDEIILVYQNPAVAALAQQYRMQAVYNPDAEQGQSASIKAGVRAASAETGSFMFLTGDQPRLTSHAVDLLIAAWREHPDRIVVPVYGGKRGSPTVFPAALRDELLKIEGDRGGRLIMEESPGAVFLVDMPESTAGIDIDTPEEYTGLS